LPYLLEGYLNHTAGTVAILWGGTMLEPSCNLLQYSLQVVALSKKLSILSIGFHQEAGISIRFIIVWDSAAR